MSKIETLLKTECCLTCAYRRFYPPTLLKNGGKLFTVFQCAMAIDTGKELVKATDVCKFWHVITIVN